MKTILKTTALAISLAGFGGSAYAGGMTETVLEATPAAACPTYAIEAIFPWWNSCGDIQAIVHPSRDRSATRDFSEKTIFDRVVDYYVENDITPVFPGPEKDDEQVSDCEPWAKGRCYQPPVH